MDSCYEAKFLKRNVIIFVAVIHLLFFFSMFFLSRWERQTTTKEVRKLTLQTVILKEPQLKISPKSTTEDQVSQPKSKQTTAKDLSKKELPKKQEIFRNEESQKKIIDKSPIIKKSNEKQERIPEKKTMESVSNSKNKELLAKAQSSLSNIKTLNKGELGSEKELQLPSLPQLNLAEASGIKNAYNQELAILLKLLLRLPERGFANVQLTILSSGKVKQVEIKECESTLNKHYLEKEIKVINFPPFSDELKNKKEHTFQLTLTSD